MFIFENTFLLSYCCILTGIFGAVMGSFLNCLAWRMAHHESAWKGRSHCTSCGHTLGILDLFPIISWLLLGGSCRYCKAKISVRYPLTEVILAMLSISCLLRYGLTIVFARNLLFLFCLFCLSLVDLEIYEIPDGCLIISAMVFVVTVPFVGYSTKEILLHVLAGVTYFLCMLFLTLLFDWILQKESMGGGDLKLFGIMGLYLGFIASIFAILLACILGLVFALVQKGRAKEGKKIAEGKEIKENREITEDREITEGREITEDREITEGREITEDGEITEGREITEDREIIEGREITEGEEIPDRNINDKIEDAVDIEGNEAMNRQIPFGPSIALATWIMLLYGMPLVSWYMSLF